MDIISESENNKIDYSKLKESLFLKMINTEHVFISVIIPVMGRVEFNSILTKHFLDAKQQYENSTHNKISITFVEHSDIPEHKQLCNNVNYIHIPKDGKPFNKSLAMNIGALFSNKADYFLFHDLDIIVPRDFFTNVHLNILKQHLDSVQCFTGRRVLYANEKQTKDIFSGILNINNISEGHDIKIGDWGAQGGSICVSKSLFFDVGGYETEFTEYSIEDSMFFTKLEIIGNLGTCERPPIELIHLNHLPCFGQRTKKYDYDFYNIFRNMSRMSQLNYINFRANIIKQYA